MMSKFDEQFGEQNGSQKWVLWIKKNVFNPFHGLFLDSGINDMRDIIDVELTNTAVHAYASYQH